MKPIKIRKSYRNMKWPVGYLSPDGRWFLIESSENGLAHIYLAEHVYQEYEPWIREQRIFFMGVDDALERAGFVKVHGWDVRYYSGVPYGGYSDQGTCRTPPVTDVQVRRLCGYIRRFGYMGEVFVNGGRRTSANDLASMDRPALAKLFSL